jgi:hypothetical protein
MRRFLLILAFGLLGCGTRDDPSAAYIGTWTGTLATEASCNDGSTIPRSTFPVQALITKGTVTDLVCTMQTGMACVTPLNIQGKVVATLVDLGDGCATADGKPLRLMSWSVDQLGDDLIAIFAGGRIDAPAAGGTCAVIVEGTLTR